MYTFLRSKITTVILGALAVWLLLLAVASGIQRHSALEDLSSIETRIEDAKRENTRLTEKLERMKQPQWLALLARQRLNFKHPDETVVFVYKTEKSVTIIPPQAAEGSPAPSWRQWLDWFSGKEIKE